MLLGLVERQAQLAVACGGDEAVASVAQVLVVFVVRRDVVILVVVVRRAPAVLRADGTPR